MKQMGTKGLPASGCTIKWMQAIAVSARPTLAGIPICVSTAGAVQKAMAHLAGDVGKLPAGLMMERLATIDPALSSALPATRRTPHTLQDVCGQLCAWYHAGMPLESADYRHVMQAAL